MEKGERKEMNRIAGNDYDEENRSNELGFNPYDNQSENQIIEDLSERQYLGLLTKENNVILDKEDSKLYLFAIMDILAGRDSNEEESKLLDRMLSCFIFHKDPKKYSARETACAYLNTICDWSDIYKEENTKPDDKIYKINDLYSEYLNYLEKNKKIFRSVSTNHHKRISKKDFKTMISRGTIVKNRGQTYEKKRIWSDIAIGLPQKINWN